MSKTDSMPEGIEGFNPKELTSLPEDERKEKLRQFLSIAREKSGVKVALFDSSNNRTIDIVELAETIGDDKTAEILNKILSEASNVNGIKISREKMSEIFEKEKAGTLTPEDKLLLNLIHDYMKNSIGDTARFMQNFIDAIMNFLYMSKNKLAYNVSVTDMCVTLSFILSEMFRTDEDYKGFRSALYESDPNTLTSVAISIAEKIDEAFTASMTEKMDPTLYILGLLGLVAKVAHNNDMMMGDIGKLAEVMNANIKDEVKNADTEYAKTTHEAEKAARLDMDFFMEDCDEGVKQGIENMNGSNPQPAIIQPNIVSNQDKKDRLKDL